MLKTTESSNISRLEIWNGNGEVIGFGIGDSSEEFAKKSEKLSKGLKLSKSGNLKDKKLAKSKKPSKSGNSPNFNAKKVGSSFLTPETRAAFNHLRLIFIKAQIFWHFDLEYQI